MIKGALIYFYILGLQGVLALILYFLTGKKQQLLKSAPNCRHKVSLRVHSADITAYKQIFIYKEYDFSTKSKPKIIVDLGANIGLTSVYFANKFPEARIIAIEPERNNFNELKRNTRDYNNIETLNLAVWNEDGFIELNDSGLGEMGYTTNSVNSQSDPNTTSRVQALTINSLLSLLDIEFIDILKIDIEGAELELFQNTSSWLSNTKSIIIELHDRMKPGCSRSFYNGSNGFPYEWKKGENIYLSRGIIQQK